MRSDCVRGGSLNTWEGELECKYKGIQMLKNHGNKELITLYVVF